MDRGWIAVSGGPRPSHHCKRVETIWFSYHAQAVPVADGRWCDITGGGRHPPPPGMLHMLDLPPWADDQPTGSFRNFSTSDRVFSSK